MLRIHFKETTNTRKLNRELSDLGLNKIVDKDFLDEWVDEINNNPEELEKHKSMFGFDKASVENLKYAYKSFAAEFRLEVDFYFGRIEQEEATLFGNFIYKHKGDIEYIKDGIEFTNRFDFSDIVKETILELNKPYEEPEKLPIEEQYIPDLQSGVVLVKSWAEDPFWIIYGKVEKPTFLKKKIYVNGLYNEIYRDDKGLAYLLVPLAPMGATYDSFINGVYEDAFSVGLRESYPFFVTMVYGAIFPIDDLVEYIKTSYTREEIIEKYYYMSNHLKNDIELLNVEWDDNAMRYVSIKYESNSGKLDYFSALERVILNDNELYQTTKNKKVYFSFIG